MERIYIFLIILFIFIIISLNSNNIKEGFFESYDNCIEQGYPHNFCFYGVPLRAKV